MAAPPAPGFPNRDGSRIRRARAANRGRQAGLSGPGLRGDGQPCRRWQLRARAGVPRTAVTIFRDVARTTKKFAAAAVAAEPQGAAGREQQATTDAHCLPMGLMQFHNHGQPRKIVQTPGLIVIIYEANYGLRQIFLDGRKLPASDAQPFWYGYSVGKWEGDTLVVETTGFRDGGWLDIIGNPLTDAARMTERFRRPNFGTLEIDITIDDPKAYTKPWTVRVNQRVMLDGELIEFICLENQQFESYLKGQK